MRDTPRPCLAMWLVTSSRDTADLARLAHYARKLDADVIAFQEVENQRAARRVFRGYDICINPGKGVQHGGVRRARRIAHRCEPPLQALAQGNRQRAGARLMLYPGTSQQIELLAVHLKSGCSRDALDSGDAACRTLAAQGAGIGRLDAATRRRRMRALSSWVTSIAPAPATTSSGSNCRWALPRTPRSAMLQPAWHSATAIGGSRFRSTSTTSWSVARWQRKSCAAAFAITGFAAWMHSATGCLITARSAFPSFHAP